jgi:hypothetical protein
MSHAEDAWDIAYAAQFLASEAKYIAGTELVVDEGLQPTAFEHPFDSDLHEHRARLTDPTRQPGQRHTTPGSQPICRSSGLLKLLKPKGKAPAIRIVCAAPRQSD